MHVIEHRTAIRTAVKEPGKQPDNPTKLYKLELVANTEADFGRLEDIMRRLKTDAEQEGRPVIVEDATPANLAAKLQAAKNN